MASTSKTIAELISSDLTVDVANTDIVGVITDNQIAAISNTKITGTLTAPQIADAAITPAKLCQSFLTPTGDGSGLTGISAGLTGPRANLYTSPGSWPKPTGVDNVKVTVVGGGGGGGGGTQPGLNCGQPGRPGARGGIAIDYVNISACPSVPVTTGPGGSAGPVNTNGGAGGTTSFGAFASATGGGGGVRGFYPCICSAPFLTTPGLGQGGIINSCSGNDGLYICLGTVGSGGGGGMEGQTAAAGQAGQSGFVLVEY